MPTDDDIDRGPSHKTLVLKILGMSGIKPEAMLLHLRVIVDIRGLRALPMK